MSASETEELRRAPRTAGASARLAGCQTAAVVTAGLLVVACRSEVSTTAIELANVGFATPESVIHDPDADVYLVSNVNGDPFAHDGNGFVSRVSPDGTVLALKWIDGTHEGVALDAPKGMAFLGDLLFVADIDSVRAFDRRTGAPRGSVEIDGAMFLNDVATGPGDCVHVSDTGVGPGFTPAGGDAIYRVGRDLKVETVAKSAALGEPNGLFASGNDLFYVGWASGDFCLLRPDGAPEKLVHLPAAQLDGLVRASPGRWLASSWAGQCVYSIDPGGNFTVVKEGLEAPAGIGWDAERSRLLIPLFTSDAVRIEPLPE